MALNKTSFQAMIPELDACIETQMEAICLCDNLEKCEELERNLHNQLEALDTRMDSLEQQKRTLVDSMTAHEKKTLEAKTIARGCGLGSECSLDRWDCLGIPDDRSDHRPVSLDYSAHRRWKAMSIEFKFTPHFPREEIQCKCCGRIGPYAENLKSLVTKLEKLRELAGGPLLRIPRICMPRLQISGQTPFPWTNWRLWLRKRGSPASGAIITINLCMWTSPPMPDGISLLRGGGWFFPDSRT